MTSYLQINQQLDNLTSRFMQKQMDLRKSYYLFQSIIQQMKNMISINEKDNLLMMEMLASLPIPGHLSMQAQMKLNQEVQQEPKKQGMDKAKQEVKAEENKNEIIGKSELFSTGLQKDKGFTKQGDRASIAYKSQIRLLQQKLNKQLMAQGQKLEIHRIKLIQLQESIKKTNIQIQKISTIKQPILTIPNIQKSQKTEQIQKPQETQKIQQPSVFKQTQKCMLPPAVQKTTQHQSPVASPEVSPDPCPSPAVSPTSSWLNPAHEHISHLVIHHSSVTAKKSAFMVGKNLIEDRYEFTVKFQNMKTCAGLGLVDVGGNCYIRYRSDGYCCDGDDEQERQGDGFAVGELVTLQVDLTTFQVVWKVANMVRHKLKSKMLQKKETKWVPYVYLNNQGDKVRLIM